jgi:enediyne biosynthesis protein CalE5
MENEIDDTARGWEKWSAWTARNMRPVMDWLCRGAGIGPGQRVLDVACGTGQPALLAAERVGPSGSVLATDVSPAMLAGAERIARAGGATNIEFRAMAAEALDLPDATFDAATFSFGLMFCSDQPRAIAELRRVLKPGARFALSVWDLPAKNPFFTTVFQAVSRFAPPPPAPSGPGMFSLGEEGALARLLSAGGVQDFSIESVAFVTELESLDQHFELFSDMAPPVRAAAKALPKEALGELREALAEALAPYRDGDCIRLPATALCARAVR